MVHFGPFIISVNYDTMHNANLLYLQKFPFHTRNDAV